VPGCVSPNQLNLAAPAFQGFHQKAHQRFVGRGIHRGSGNFDPQFTTQRFANFIARRSGLELNGEQNTV
jgi:hypothetical protein